MEFYSVFNQILMLFLLIVVGFVARVKNVFDEQTTKGMSSALLKIFLPCMIISSMQKNFSVELLRESFLVLILSFLVYGISFLIALILPFFMKVKSGEIGVFQFMALFSNVGFMGYPVLQAIFGKEALFYAAIYNLPFNFLAFTIGIILLTKERREEVDSKFDLKLLINPGVVAVLIGFFLFVTGIKLPTAVNGSIKLLGDITPPFSMIVVGAMLAKENITNVFKNLNLYIISIVRLLLIPLVIWLVLKPFIQNNLILGIAVVTAAMPVAANTPILAEEYGGNSELGSQGVLVSTLFSIFTIPLIAFLFV